MAFNGQEMVEMLRRILSGFQTAQNRTSGPSVREKKDTGHTRRRPTDIRERFYEDVRRFADRTAPETAPVPMHNYWPMYENMSPKQTAWYFYWRSQVRAGIYPETDEAYILLNCYEILCGCGWTDAQEGYDHMKHLLEHYRAACPRLDFVLTDWLFDFALMHGVRFDLPLTESGYEIKSPVMADVLTAIAWDQALEEKAPVRLQFPVIAVLSDYKIEESRFYRDGHAALMQHVVPRVLSLLDASAIRENRPRPFERLSLGDPMTSRRDIYTGALCPEAGSPVTVAVIPYFRSPRLRDWLGGIIRMTENELRRLTGYRGRLRGNLPDGKEASLIREFLEHEYGVKKKEAVREETIAASEETKETDISESEQQAAPAIELDFEKIDMLRRQSDAVREALRVDEDAQEEEIISREVEDEEKGHQEKIEYATERTPFCVDQLDGDLKTLMQQLTPVQQKMVAICLDGQGQAGQLAQLADEAMSMPAMMMDEINQTALEVIGDILLEEAEPVPEIVTYYREPLLVALIIGA